MRRLNPAWKLLTLILASLLLSFSYILPLNLMVFGFCLLGVLLTPGVHYRRLLLGLIPFLLAAAGMFMTALLFPAHPATGEVVGTYVGNLLFDTQLNNALKLASRILAYGGLGMLFAFTTDSQELILGLMQQFRLPPKFAYGILAAYHFFPRIQEEYELVGAALKVRGIRTHPLSTLRLMPMLARALQRSESLAMAMESRGFEDGAPRSEAFRVPFGPIDIAFFILLPALILLGIFFL